MISSISQVIATHSSPLRETTSSTSSDAAVQTAAGQGQASVVEAVSAQVKTSGGGQVTGSDQDLAEAVERLNAKVQNLNRNLEFSIDKDNGEVLVRVVDAQTHKVVRQIPSEEALALAHNIDKYLEEHHTGLMQAKA